MSDTPRLTVRRSWSRSDPAVLAPFRDAPTGWVADAQGRLGALPHWIRPLSRATRFVGSALTVATRPVDNLAPYAALRFARPGDVLIVAADGADTGSVMGDILIGMARNAGIVGIVTDGLVRDIGGINAVGLPTFARALSPNSPFKDGPGSVGLPVVIGGLAVSPGDMVIGDDDGVAVVPRDTLEAVAGRLPAIAQKEAEMERAVENGAAQPPWLDGVLDSGSVRYVD